MPFIKVDAEIFDEIVSEMDPEFLPEGFADNKPSGEFEYEAKVASFKSSELPGPAQLLLQALLQKGATHFRVTYNGGYDEGFSNAEDVTIAGVNHSVADLSSQFAATPLVASIQETSRFSKHYHFSGKEPQQVIQYSFDELAHALASLLLGDGYGTGEYELYGAFTAVLGTGEIIDDPKAVKPD